MLALTILFIIALLSAALLNGVPAGTSWTSGGFARVNRGRRLLGSAGLIASVGLMLVLVGNQ